MSGPGDGVVRVDEKKSKEEVRSAFLISTHSVALLCLFKFKDVNGLCSSDFSCDNLKLINAMVDISSVKPSLIFQITAEFNKVQNEYYNSLIVEMKDDCETYRKATE